MNKLESLLLTAHTFNAQFSLSILQSSKMSLSEFRKKKLLFVFNAFFGECACKYIYCLTSRNTPRKFEQRRTHLHQQ